MTEFNSDTIIALSSGQGRAGVAVIRISGPKAFQSAIDLTAKRLPPPREAVVRWVVDEDGFRVDQVLLVRFSGPESFTGEDVVELHCHGSMAVVSKILQLATQTSDVRLAEAGEFSRRAFENNKLDLLQAEAIADLIDSDSEAQLKQAAKFLAGDASETISGWRRVLLEASALLAATIDFSDEGDVSEDVHLPAVRLLEGLKTEFETSLKNSKKAARVRDGVRLAILGKPNAGKSSLINALLAREAAIVSDIPGTTRDIVESQILISGVPVTIADTAGLRDSDDPIEAEGVRRAIQWAENADLRLYLSRLDAGSDSVRPVELKDNDLWIGSQSDRVNTPIRADYDLRISVATGEGMDRLASILTERVADMTSESEAPVVVRLRHQKNLSTALEAISQSLTLLIESGDVDLAEFELSIARSALDQILGRVDVEDILGEVFAGFCVGK
ncbi:MAG: tRNA uridine-5-carboxymethylaminomethyl(34) synthesis GTPase MnmE [Ponticaulis sp.]|nr:tRNA uridine-5-carboxymethylaminomethyl(34) synthesis GTPase MnmE [Ponticaulis sp.]